MPFPRLLLLLTLALPVSGAPLLAQGADPSRAAVSRVLDDLHDAAAKAQFDRYFGLFSKDGIFLGTDATENWTVDEFKDYARPSFEAGRGWTYVSRVRQIFLSPDGDSAWFDELLDNASLGETRGSGVLVLENGAWRIAQYNLSIPIPNALAGQVVTLIRQAKGG